MIYEYKTEDVLKQCYMISSIYAANKVDAEGKFIGDQFILSDDEEIIFRTFLNKAHQTVSKHFSKNGVVEFLKYEININDYENESINDIIFDLITNIVLLEWFSVKDKDIALDVSEKVKLSNRQLREVMFLLNKR